MLTDLFFAPLPRAKQFNPLWDSVDTLMTTTDSHLDKAFNEMDKWFDDTLKLTKAAVSLPFNLFKTSVDGEYVYEIAVAGYDPEKISIYHTDNQLKINYESDVDAADRPTYLYHGIRGRNFDMTFTVPVEAEVTSQKIKNGILTITVQTKKPETKKAKKLKISVE